MGQVPAVSRGVQRFKCPAITIHMIALLQVCIHFKQFTAEASLGRSSECFLHSYSNSSSGRLVDDVLVD